MWKHLDDLFDERYSVHGPLSSWIFNSFPDVYDSLHNYRRPNARPYYWRRPGSATGRRRHKAVRN